MTAKVAGNAGTTPAQEEIATNAQMDIATRTVSALLLSERRAAAEERLQDLQARWDESQQQREATASAVLAVAGNLSDGEQAAAYRQLIASFPSTGAAVLAEKRLPVLE